MIKRILISPALLLFFIANANAQVDTVYDHPVLSDGQFKFNVRNDVKGLEFILKLKPVTYQLDVKKIERTLKGTNVELTILKHQQEEETRLRRTGFIAQEVEQAAWQTGYEFSGVKKPATDKDFYRISYESFVMPLVKAVQEQQTMIDVQQARIDVQEEKIKLLQSRLDALMKTVAEFEAHQVANTSNHQ